MNNPIPGIKAIAPQQRETLRGAELRSNAENDRWENEGGAVKTIPAPQASVSPPATRRIQADFVILISGLLLCFGLVTVIMTIGAKPEEARVTAAMTFYGAASMAAGVGLAASYWFWRSFRACAP